MNKDILNNSKELSVSRPWYRDFVKCFFQDQLKNDLGDNGDITSKTIFGTADKLIIEAIIEAKSNGIMAGLHELSWYLKNEHKTLRLQMKKKDGDEIKNRDIIAVINGPAIEILKIERVILNFLQRMSGIATFTNSIVKKVKKVNKKTLIVPTRKTGWGLLDKKAVTMGGGGTHRLNLSDAILVKDNHLKTISKFKVQSSKQILNPKFKIQNVSPFDYILDKISKSKLDYKFAEIEVETKEDALMLAKEIKKNQDRKLFRKPMIVMLDNFFPTLIRKTLRLMDKENLRHDILIEASGGINPNNVIEFAKTGVDVISMGCLTQGAMGLDMSLEVK